MGVGEVVFIGGVFPLLHLSGSVFRFRGLLLVLLGVRPVRHEETLLVSVFNVLGIFYQNTLFIHISYLVFLYLTAEITSPV